MALWSVLDVLGIRILVLHILRGFDKTSRASIFNIAQTATKLNYIFEINLNMFANAFD